MKAKHLYVEKDLALFLEIQKEINDNLIIEKKDADNYFIFKDGQIYNKDRKKYLKPIKNDSGYCYVTLCQNQNKKIIIFIYWLLITF